MKIINKIINYILLTSPILVTSFFVYKSDFPAWSNTMMLALLISFLILSKNIYSCFKNKKINILDFSLLLSGFIVFVIYSALSAQSFYFNAFGKGVAEWSGISILSLFVVFTYFISSKYKTKMALILTITPIVYTALNFVFIQYNLSIANYTGYLNIPMISFNKLVNYPLVFSIVTLFAIILNYFINKKGIIFSDLKLSKLLKLFLIVLISLFVFSLFNYTLRYMAASKYMSASNSFSAGKIEQAKAEISKAITIAPYDVYYLGRIDIMTSEINALLQSKATNTDKLQNEYKLLVEYQINDAKKAINYDDKNPQNYMALGYAYERAMVITKDGAYDMAIKAYEEARKIATDKDYVDVVKAKTAFSAEKENEGLGFIDSALRFNSSSSAALYLSSQYYALKDKNDVAIEYAQKTVATAPYAADGRLNLGLLYLKTNKIDEAIQEFGNVLQITNGSDIGAIYYLGIAYKTKGDSENLSKVIAELEKIGMDKNSKEMQALLN